MFHFRAIKLNPDGSLPGAGEEEIKNHVIDDTRTLGCGPFELLIGREFKMDVWEKLVREMLIGEIARFTCPYKVIPQFKKKFLQIFNSKSIMVGNGSV